MADSKIVDGCCAFCRGLPVVDLDGAITCLMCSRSLGRVAVGPAVDLDKARSENSKRGPYRKREAG